MGTNKKLPSAPKKFSEVVFYVQVNLEYQEGGRYHPLLVFVVVNPKDLIDFKATAKKKVLLPEDVKSRLGEYAAQFPNSRGKTGDIPHIIDRTWNGLNDKDEPFLAFEVKDEAALTELMNAMYDGGKGFGCKNINDVVASVRRILSDPMAAIEEERREQQEREEDEQEQPGDMLAELLAAGTVGGKKILEGDLDALMREVIEELSGKKDPGKDGKGRS